VKHSRARGADDSSTSRRAQPRGPWMATYPSTPRQAFLVLRFTSAWGGFGRVASRCYSVSGRRLASAGLGLSNALPSLKRPSGGMTPGDLGEETDTRGCNQTERSGVTTQREPRPKMGPPRDHRVEEEAWDEGGEQLKGWTWWHKGSSRPAYWPDWPSTGCWCRARRQEARVGGVVDWSQAESHRGRGFKWLHWRGQDPGTVSHCHWRGFSSSIHSRRLSPASPASLPFSIIRYR